jgi:hypothetical protein
VHSDFSDDAATPRLSLRIQHGAVCCCGSGQMEMAQLPRRAAERGTTACEAAARFARGGAALKSGGSAQNESKFSVMISSRRQPSGRRDGFRLTPLRMCSCGRGLARACLLVLPWSVCLGRPAESRAHPGRAHSAAETAIPVALVVDFRALQVA